MGARIDTHERPARRCASTAARALHGIDYALPVASAQVKSALLLAALYARGRTSITEPAPTRDHTERMLQRLWRAASPATARRVSLDGRPAPAAAAASQVPGDFSSAAFFIVAGCLAARDGLTIRNVGFNPTRTGLLQHAAR